MKPFEILNETKKPKPYPSEWWAEMGLIFALKGKTELAKFSMNRFETAIKRENPRYPHRPYWFAEASRQKFEPINLVF